MSPLDDARLLPWTSPDGKPCYLLASDGTGYVARLADEMEAEQMSSAAELIEEACRILAGRTWTPGELHLLAVELNDHLTKVHRVSQSRGARLRLLDDDRDMDGGDDCDGPQPGAGVPDCADGFSPRPVPASGALP
ncbi:hypothetical protein [Streptomyces natalensis]|uniref:hypothetical protein n=1 Tax=Streptomyces natalensis TaxID=68242 RepID=UPI00099C85B4|nr:hypothetical protein [Streptomyces natalensis]